MYYVTMTDDFMSRWGKAEGKTNKLIFECETIEDMENVYNNAHARSEMKYIRIAESGRKPKYPEATHFTQTKTKKDYPIWYKQNSFSSKVTN